MQKTDSIPAKARPLAARVNSLLEQGERNVARGVKSVRENICRPSGTGSSANVDKLSHRSFQNRVLTRGLKSARDTENKRLYGTPEGVPFQNIAMPFQTIAVPFQNIGVPFQNIAMPLQISARRRRDSGAMLLAVLFMMAMMVLVAMAMAPSLVQQIKRDREEEMIHRGTEYARAIRKYYRKFGRYPANLEQLDNTNQLRFLRRRFKDPLTKDGKWKPLHYGDIAALGITGLPRQVIGAQGQVPGAGSAITQPQGAAGSDQSAGTAPAGAQLSPQQAGAADGTQSAGGAQPDGGLVVGGGGAGGQSGASPGPGGSQSSDSSGTQSQGGQTQGGPGQAGSNNSIFGNTGVGGQTFGGGAIVGVASLSKDPTIRIYNKKKTYDEWVFIYSPMMDRNNILLRGPYNGPTFIGQQIGTPAGEANPGTQDYQGAPGVPLPQPGGPGQGTTTPNQQIPPGSQFPPDQTQPQQ